MEYFLHTILDVVFILGIIFAAALLSEALGIDLNENAMAAVLFFIVIFGGIVEFCATVRRLHDINMSGWYLLLSMIPIVNIFLGLMLLFKQGDDSTNNYGPPPQ